MALKGVKAYKVFQRKSKAKGVDWVAQKRFRRTRYVPIEVSPSRDQPTPGRDTVRMEIDDRKEVFHEDNHLLSMDVDEAFWEDEPDIPKPRRVSSPMCPFLTIFDVALSLNAPSWMILFLGLAHTCAVSSAQKVSLLQPCARAAGLLRLSGGAQTAFLLLYSARSAAETPTCSFLSTEFRNGQGNISCHRGCGRLE